MNKTKVAVLCAPFGAAVLFGLFGAANAAADPGYYPQFGPAAPGMVWKAGPNGLPPMQVPIAEANFVWCWDPAVGNWKLCPP